MCHFQPDALTLSRGETWRDRRAFNEAVLAPDESWRTIVDDEVGRLRIDGGLGWKKWEELFDHITLRVVFGDRARDDQELTGLLEKLMQEANKLPGPGESDDYYEFYGRLEKYLADPQPGSLVARIPDAPQTAHTRVVQQIPHWIFAMRDTLGANAYRALAAIVADPEVERRAKSDERYLEGVLHEAMRLWPTTPLLAREVTRKTTLAGEEVAEGTTVMILNVFNHRDPELGDGDFLNPDRWKTGERNYRFNHLSNGSQDCPGGSIVLLLGTAVLSRILAEHTLELEDSPFEGGKPVPDMLDFFRLRFTAS
jgi:cytochrome P450